MLPWIKNHLLKAKHDKKQCEIRCSTLFCHICTILQCVTVVCCSRTTLQRVPRCGRSCYRRDALCSHRHGAATCVHNPQPQQQSSWVWHTGTNILLTRTTKPLSNYVELMFRVSLFRTTWHAVWFVSICVTVTNNEKNLQLVLSDVCNPFCVQTHH